MAHIYKDRISEKITTSGLSDFILTGTCESGRQSFSSLSNGDTCYYYCKHRELGEWEIGIGTYTSGILARTMIESSSASSNQKVTFSLGNKDVTLIASTAAINSINNTLSNIDTTLIWSHEVTGSSVQSITASGLDLNTHKVYKIVASMLSSNTTPGQDVVPYINEVLTNTWNGQHLWTPATGATTANANTSTVPSIGYLLNYNTTTLGIHKLMLLDSKPVLISMDSANTTGTIVWRSLKQNQTVTNVTSILFKAQTSAVIAPGSKIYIFREGT